MRRICPDTEFTVYSCILGKHYHVIGELLEYVPVPMGVASGKDIAVNRIFPIPKVKRLLAMGGCDISKFTKATASEKQTEHKDQQLSPIRQLPSDSSVLYPMFDTRLHDSFKFAFWQKVNNLAENVSSAFMKILGTGFLGSDPNIIF